MALRESQRILLAKAESSYGTDPTPGTADAVLCRAIDITPLASTNVSRDLVRGYMGNYEQILAGTHVEVSVEVELAGSGTAGTAPRFSNLLLSCGTELTTVSSTSNTYTPISSTFPSSTLWFYVDGQRHKVNGARGSFSINAEVSAIPTINFTFTGVYVAPGASANPTPSYGAQTDPVIFNKDNTTAFQLHSYAAALQSFSYDNANQVVYRELVGGTKEVLITERAPNGSVTIEAPALGTKDYFAIANTSGSTGNLTFQHGQTAGNKCTFTAAQTDLLSPSYTYTDGCTMLTVPYNATPTTAGNNEFSLKFH